MDLDAYRSSAEEFSAAITLEYYRHFAGLSDSFELEPIYDRHAALFTHGAVDGLRNRHQAAAPDSDAHRRLEILVDFAVEGLLGQVTKELEEELAEREAQATIELDGEQLGFRQAAVVQAGEADPARRLAIHAALMQATAGSLNPLHRELVDARQSASRELGFASYRELCEVTKRLDLAGLHASTEAFRETTDARYRELLETHVGPVVGCAFRHADLPRLRRAPQLDDAFRTENLIGTFQATLAALGIDPRAQPGVVYDIESRPNKSPRAFCCPVRPPDEVYLVIAPAGGFDDYGAMFHEGGHTEHYAHVERGLPFEYRMLGDNAVTECFAFLLQHLLENARWLERVHGCADPEPVMAQARAERLLMVRRYAAKLSYELELHAGGRSWDGYAERYVELVGGALHAQWSRESFLSDVDSGYYSSCYLRAWALEAHLRRHLIARYGEEWFAQPGAAGELRALWGQGQRLTAEELLEQLTGQQLDFTALLQDLG